MQQISIFIKNAFRRMGLLLILMAYLSSVNSLCAQPAYMGKTVNSEGIFHPGDDYLISGIQKSIQRSILKSDWPIRCRGFSPEIQFEIIHGAIEKVRIFKSSGDAASDRQAIEAIKNLKLINLPAPIPDILHLSCCRMNSHGIVRVEPIKDSDWSASGLAESKKIKQKQDAARSLNNSAATCIDQGRYKEAVALLKQAKALRHDYDVADSNYSLAVQKWLGAGLEDNPLQAATMVRAALWDDPANELLLQKLNEAIVALGKNPESYIDRMVLGDECMKSGDATGAAVEYRAARELMRIDNYYQKAGRSLYAMNEDKFSKAFAQIQQ